ncbi:MAG: helix-turn-helix transcriptional regulator [Deltaproteobacteria bacterium]|nr:helix-turn-helix transcriptional regulator [Deltaproteobacteria bacterium]
MDRNRAAVIDLVEAAYNLELPPAEWLPNVLRAGEPLLDFGMGYYGAIGSGASEQGVPIVTQVQAAEGAEELPVQIMRAAQEVGPDVVKIASAASLGRVVVLSETRNQWPQAYEALTRNVGCKDMLSLTAVDPDHRGVNISIPSPELIELDPKQRWRWQMIEAHLAAGHRLRRSLDGQSTAPGVPMTDMPLNAEALVDPARFVVAEATGDAQGTEAATSIREAARLVDKARGPLRNRDPEEALRLWEGLVRGRWTLVDWFDTDGRRFVLARPNAPRIADPRGLSELEAQVATYASHGEASKMISYRLGLSPSYVSRLLNDAMRKLGVKTQPQLVEKMRGIPESAA